MAKKSDAKKPAGKKSSTGGNPIVDTNLAANAAAAMIAGKRTAGG